MKRSAGGSSRPELCAYGVQHATIYRGQPTHSVEHLFEALKRDGVKRLGVEHLHDDAQINPEVDVNVFWRDVAERAKRERIKLVPLEGGPAVDSLVWFQDHILDTMFRLHLAEEEGFGTNLDGRHHLLMRASGKDLLYELPPGEFTEKVKRMQAATAEHFHRFTKTDGEELLEALAASRSIKMHAEAASRKLTHIATGSAHALDFEHLGQAKAVLTQRMPARLLRNSPEARFAFYEKHKPLIERLWQIAQS